jgi:membrane protein YqaA with SNARE-associated domain
MFSVGEAFYGLFSPLGLAGWLICVFLLFYIDAIVFPTLPELFVVLFFMAGHDTMPDWALWSLFVLTIAVAEVLGLTTLYLVIRRVRVPPKIASAVERYRRFLLCTDERMILLNRVAPILPFIGAFVAICNWSFRRSVFYLVLGGTLKYGLILAASSYFLTYFEKGLAADFTLLMVIAIMAISFIVSTYRKRRAGQDGGECGQSPEL